MCGYFIGVDGGGTKTRFSCWNKGMENFESFELATCHIAQAGVDGMRSILGRGLHRAMDLAQAGQAGSLQGIGYGLAGYGVDRSCRTTIERVVQEVSNGIPYLLVDDVEASWAASLDMNDGIVVIAGTGSIAFAGINGWRRRCGGWGPVVGDEGSGFWIGRSLLSLYSKEADGRMPRAATYDLMAERLSLTDPGEIVPFGAGADRTLLASLSPILFEAIEQGDSGADAVCRKAAAELAQLVTCLIKQAIKARGIEAFKDDEISISYVGGLLVHHKIMLRYMKDALDDDLKTVSLTYRIIAPRYVPDAGPVLMLRRSLQTAR